MTASLYWISLNNPGFDINQRAFNHIRKIAGCACAQNVGNVFPVKANQPLVNDPGMHHGTRLKAFPAFPAHEQPVILRIWEEAHRRAPVIYSYCSAHVPFYQFIFIAYNSTPCVLISIIMRYLDNHHFVLRWCCPPSCACNRYPNVYIYKLGRPSLQQTRWTVYLVEVCHLYRLITLQRMSLACSLPEALSASSTD